MKRILLSLLAIVFIIAGIFVLVEYQKIRAVQNLEIGVARITLDDVSFTGLTVNLLVSFHNPNKIEVKTGLISADVFANGIKIGSLSFEPMVLVPGESLERPASFRLSYLDVGSALLQAFKEGSVSYKVKGEYVLQLPFGIEYPYRFEMSRTTSESGSSLGGS